MVKLTREEVFGTTSLTSPRTIPGVQKALINTRTVKSYRNYLVHGEIVLGKDIPNGIEKPKRIKTDTRHLCVITANFGKKRKKIYIHPNINYAWDTGNGWNYINGSEITTKDFDGTMLYRI